MCVFGAFIYDAIADGKNRFIFKNFKESEFLISGLNFMGGSPFEIKKIGGKIRKKKSQKKTQRQKRDKTRQRHKTKQNKKKMIFGHRREEQGLKVFYENTERRTRFASTSKRREGFDG